MLHRILLRIYELLRRSRLLNAVWGRRIFEACYSVYKVQIETRNFRNARRFVKAGDLVIDVGANIGVLTGIFSKWVGTGGRVIAIEPEPLNIARLRERLGGPEHAPPIDIVPAAASDRVGEAILQITPHHPGDHHLVENRPDTGDVLAVPSITIDQLLADRGNPCPSLVKIDVQGAEMRVLRGARDTLKRCRPVVLMEIDRIALARAQSNESEVREFLAALGYVPHDLRTGRPLDVHSSVLEPDIEYADLLFIPAA